MAGGEAVEVEVAEVEVAGAAGLMMAGEEVAEVEAAGVEVAWSMVA